MDRQSQAVAPLYRDACDFAPDKPVDQSLFPGKSIDQVEGIVDFLMNYDTYMTDRTSIKPMVKPAAPATDAAATPAAQLPTAR